MKWLHFYPSSLLCRTKRVALPLICFYWLLFSALMFTIWKKERVAKTLCSIHKNGLVNMICQFFLCKAEMFCVNFFPLATPRIPRPWPDRCFQQNIVTLFAPIAMLCRDEAKSQYLNEFNFSSSLDAIWRDNGGEKKLCSILFCPRKSWECNMYNMSACSWCQ